MHHTPSRYLLAGLAGTIVMSIVQAMAPAMGLPPMNIPAMLASMFGGSRTSGWIVHLMMGAIVWPAAYGYLVEARLPGTPWDWVGRWPRWVFSGHLIYGTVLGAVAGGTSEQRTGPAG